MAKARPTQKARKRKPSAFDAEQARNVKDLRRSLALEKRVAGLVKALSRAVLKSDDVLDALRQLLIDRATDQAAGNLARAAERSKPADRELTSA